MIRSTRQLARVCRALLSEVGLKHLWTLEGPTHEANLLFEGDGRTLEPEKRTFLLIALEFWRSQEKPDFSSVTENLMSNASLAQLMPSLDSDKLEKLGEVLNAIATGPEAVDAWLKNQMNSNGNGEIHVSR